MVTNEKQNQECDILDFQIYPVNLLFNYSIFMPIYCNIWVMGLPFQKRITENGLLVSVKSYTTKCTPPKKRLTTLTPTVMLK